MPSVTAATPDVQPAAEVVNVEQEQQQSVASAVPVPQPTSAPLPEPVSQVDVDSKIPEIPIAGPSPASVPVQQSSAVPEITAAPAPQTQPVQQ
eukprot:g13097.t1